MPSIRQGNFSAGELSPYLWGRTDMGLRAFGLRSCRNFFISRHGALVSRPGLRFCGKAKNTGLVGWRLIPFIYSDSQSYVLEMGENYLRVWTAGGVAVTPVDGAVAGELATPYTGAELAQLKSVQSGDVITFTHPAHEPRELRRLGHNNWTLAGVDFTRPVITPPASCMVLKTPLPVADADHPEREWQWLVTQLSDDVHGNTTESAPYLVTSDDAAAPLPARLAVYFDRTVTLVLYPAGAGISGVRHRIYRGRGKLFGWIGDIDGGDPLEFTDTGEKPDYARPPPRGMNPFALYDNSVIQIPPKVDSIENPAVVGYFEDRRMFANTPTRPGNVFGSAVGDHTNFDSSELPVADQAGEWELSCRRREEIRNIVPIGNKVMLLSNSAVWSFGGAGGPLSPAGLVDAKAHIDIGSAWLDALVVGNTVLYARAKGTGVRDLMFDLQLGTYSGGDISFVAQHLFENRSIVDWCFQEDPWGVVWAVRSDGRLLSLTYDRDRGVLAYALHLTGDREDGSFDIVRAVCSVPDTDKDTVFVLVERFLNGTTTPVIERFASRILPFKQDGKTPDEKEMIALDCARLSRDPGTFIINGLGDFDGLKVTALVDGNVMGPFTVAAGEIDVTAPDAGGTGLDVESDPADIEVVHVGLTYTPEVELLDIAQDAQKQKLITQVGFEVVNSRGLEVGQDFDNLEPWQQRSGADGYSALSMATAEEFINVDSSWNPGGRAVLRQTDPLFTTVVAVTRKFELGGPT